VFSFSISQFHTLFQSSSFPSNFCILLLVLLATTVANSSSSPSYFPIHPPPPHHFHIFPSPLPHHIPSRHLLFHTIASSSSFSSFSSFSSSPFTSFSHDDWRIRGRVPFSPVVSAADADAAAFVSCSCYRMVIWEEAGDSDVERNGSDAGQMDSAYGAGWLVSMRSDESDTGRETGRHKERQKERERKRETLRETDKERDRERWRDNY